MKSLFKSLIIVSLYFCFPSLALAANYYVSPTGSDSNSGTEASPWSIQKAASTAVAGDTVYLRGGTYQPTSRIFIRNSGSQDAGYITFTNYSNEVPTIDGTNTDSFNTSGLITIQNSSTYPNAGSFVRIKGLTIINSKYFGIYARSANHIMIENNTTNNTVSSGIKFHTVADSVIDGNKVSHACRYVNGQLGDQENISVGSGSSNIEVKNNEVFSPDGKEQIDIKGGCMHCSVHHNYIHDIGNLVEDGVTRYGVGIYIDAYSELQQDIDVYSNRINCDDDLSSGPRNAAMGIAMSSEQPVGGVLDDVKIYNNIISNCGESGGIKLTNWCTSCTPDSSGNTTGLKRNILIANNTTYNNYGPGIDIQQGSRAENVKVYNNISYNNTLGQIWVGSDVAGQTTISNNLSFGYSGNTKENKGVNHILANPLLTNISSISSYDFHLQSTSPAINAGMTVADIPAVDYDGKSRPIGSAWDIGAYEYGTGGTPTSPSPSPSVSPSPSPSPKPGDTNNDNLVNEDDYTTWHAHYKQSLSGATNGDFDGNGIVDGVDYIILINNYGK